VTNPFNLPIHDHLDTGQGDGHGRAAASRVLLSFCNLPELRSSGLLLFDVAKGPEQWVDIGAGSDRVRSCVGLFAHADRVCSIWIDGSDASYLTLLHRTTLNVVAVSPLEAVKDPHSACIVGDSLYVVSTGADEVVRFVIEQDVPRFDAVVWRASGDRRDTHHVNAILPVDDDVWCSAFGPKASDKWSSAIQGYVVAIASGTVVLSGIEQPHSLARGPGGIHVTESRRARVRSIGGGTTLEVDGYARGLAFLHDGTSLVGVSQGRDRSRSLGTVENPADTGVLAGHAAVQVFRPGEAARAWDLSSFGPEIYDIIAI